MYNVFLVDDEPFILEGLYDTVDWPAFGLEVAGSAENGEEALALMRVTPVDLLITDISMPYMNGLELIRRARELRPELKVVILSGFNEFDYLKEGMRLGIENYLLKPINVKELNDTLRTTVEKLDNLKPGALMSEDSVQMMTDNTMFRWVNGRMSEAEFAERAAMLGIRMNEPYGLAAVLRPAASDPETSERAFRTAAEAAAEGEDEVAFRDMNDDIVIVAGLRDPEEDKPRLLQRLAKLRKRLEPVAAVRLSLGSVYPLRGQIAESYREAKKAQEYFMMYPEWEWVDYGDTAAVKREELTAFPIDWEDYARRLLAKDREGLSGRIAGDFEELRRREGMTPAGLQAIAAELIVRFKMELQAVKHEEEPELFSLGFERVRTAPDYAGLAEAVRLTAERCIDSLERDARSPIVLQVLAEIQEHYAEELSLKALGARYHIHPVYLGQLFQKETGENFTEYINRYRIDKAKELLKSSRLKVHEIARAIGYWETGYFYKQFRKYVGISPTEFKGL
ncbi:response regulator transcription factor [Cohnella zeiphila]|uniref:Response regulator transcription factor n=1 Tax=Cohnella zeiphila TaxID=2761120 RepID=A0A7X0VUR6_9BACL|nr:response regulator transcription factor [Cohnella zeiphila]MBB6730567.1 response regulator transcription factor [Cohnella zeiphila]